MKHSHPNQSERIGQNRPEHLHLKCNVRRRHFRYIFEALLSTLLFVSYSTSSTAQDDRTNHQPISQQRQQQQRLLDLTYHPDRAEQIKSLDLLRKVTPDHAIKRRVVELATNSSDTVIRGYARILATDWGIEIGDSKAVVPNNKVSNIRITDSSPIGFELSDEPAPVKLISAISETESVVEASHSSIAFTMPRPYWQESTSTHQSLPADVIPNDVQVQDESLRARPGILDRSIKLQPEDDITLEQHDFGLLEYPAQAPLGFTGPSGLLPTEYQTTDHFVPMPDRWRIGFPSWDRYGRGHPFDEDYPYQEGSIWDPYNQNVLKGDFPILGQHLFLNVTGTSLTVHEFRQVPTATTPFESTRHPFQSAFFGDPSQFFYTPTLKLVFDLFHGNAAFKPIDWRVHFGPVFNVNYLDVNELAVVNPDVRRGTSRLRNDFALEEWFVEYKLADLSPDYDFLATRVGSQFFVSDFRGFLFRDTNRAVRLFGSRLSNRDQFNAVWFDQAEKDTNSELNTFDDRHQNVLILNYYRQDFGFPGYTAEVSFHYNRDKPSFHFDNNDVLVRPDPAGSFTEHQVDAYYIGVGGEGHIGRINVVNQFYVALGTDSINPIAGCEQTINAQMAALELSYDRDWIRFRTSYFFASGDDNPNDLEAGGFDTIMDDPIFAGGEFSYWQRQSIRLFGTNLVQRKSLVPNLRSSKIQGQSNFVNPGLHLFNAGMDFEVTPKLKLITNANYLFFDHTSVLETFTFQRNLSRGIGTDLSMGMEYRPRLNDNVIVLFGVAALLPAQGLKDLFGTEVPPNLADLVAVQPRNELVSEIPKFNSTFLEVIVTY